MNEQNKSNFYYQIVIKGRLDARWQEWFDNFTLDVTEEEYTVLSGSVADQAALHGILKRINNLGLTLISVNPQERKDLMTENVFQKDTQNNGPTFQEKSAGVSLLVIGSAAAYYFVRVLPMRSIALAGTDIPEGYGGLLLTTLGMIVVMQIVLQVILAVGSGTTSGSTFQKQAALKAKRNAYFVLTGGILAVLGLLFVNYPAFCMANFAMFALLLAEITGYASLLFYYRRMR